MDLENQEVLRHSTAAQLKWLNIGAKTAKAATP